MPRRQATTRHDASEAITTSSSSARQPSSSQTQTKKRVKAQSGSPGSGHPDSSNMGDRSRSDERRPLLDGTSNDADNSSVVTEQLSWISRNQWIVFALASGACAAFNGVFAKLTTTELTTSFAQALAGVLHLSDFENMIEVIVRSIFFGLNLVFNGVMWTLFTTALTRGNSTTQVSIINTSSNFVITAILGVAIFSESLPPLWWLGAAMLVAGNVIIGQKDEGGSKSSIDSPGSTSSSPTSSPEPNAEDGRGTYHRIPGVDEPVFIPRDEKDDDDVLDLNADGTL